MLERLVYQLEQQVKSFEKSVQTLKLQLEVYQNKELGWVEEERNWEETIQYARRMTERLRSASGYLGRREREAGGTVQPHLANLTNL
jgi:hypothetical protein